jgi:hypothetical protein
MLLARDVDADLRGFSARGPQRSVLRARDAHACRVRDVQTQCPYLSRVMSMLDFASTMEHEWANAKPFGLAARKFAATIIEAAATTMQTPATLKPKT